MMGSSSSTARATVIAHAAGTGHAAGTITSLEMERLVADTTALQHRAADPTASAWVSANAGTGKTHVLTQRVLRLLLAGTPPSRILCLTYTKAAAAEMSTRVFDTLASWVGLPDDALEAKLRAITGARGDGRIEARTLQLARTLFTAAIETPGGFQVQTIHAFAERLLQRFPLEAGVAPGFTILDEAATKALMREATDATLRTAADARHCALGMALLTVVRYAADETFDAVLAAALSNRALVASLSAADETDQAFAGLERSLRAVFGVPQNADPVRLEAELADVLDDETLTRLIAVLGLGLPSERKNADKLKVAIGASNRTRIAAMQDYFLTAEMKRRDRLLSVATQQQNPELASTVGQAQRRFMELGTVARGLDVVCATMALHRLAAGVYGRFVELKSARAALDFEDLIARTSQLFADASRAAWVLYKLDGGIDHVLVDEAQDTSPTQWQIIGAIVTEFFGDAGAGSDRNGLARTVFAVGDEKQSIYSFQGAAPEMFAANGRRFEALVRSAGRGWQPAALTLSWRSVSPVLDLVDATFANAARTPGLRPPTIARDAAMARDGDDATATIHHQARRSGQAGFVEIWPIEQPDEKTATDAWSPLDEEGWTSPTVRLATRIAATIRGWLDGGERLDSEDRLITPGDIIVLVRKRGAIAPAIVAALKKHNVPVAGADRITLADQLVVQDMLALGDFLTLPEDDLALANVLKGPLFGHDDDDLLVLAHNRRGTLWKALLDAGRGDDTRGRFATTVEQLKRWRKQADFLPPFEFFAQVLDRDGGRNKLLTRLGLEAADPLDEFMNLALSFDDEAPPSLTGFLAWLRDDDRTVKRDMEQGRDEVRVLTVHGAKGLEAPIVFLPDQCWSGGRSKSILLPISPRNLPDDALPISIWPIAMGRGLAPIDTARDEMKVAEFEESCRLLYVAMTRPRDRLYVVGAGNGKTVPVTCWYRLIEAGLDDPAISARVEERVEHDPTKKDEADGGRRIRTLRARQADPPALRRRAGPSVVASAARPAWLSAPAPREVRPVIPFAPSRIAPYDHDAAGEPSAHSPERESALRQAIAAQTPAPAATTADGDARFVRGTLTHALLEHLPGVANAQRAEVARGFIERRGVGLPAGVRANIVEETLKVLADPVFAGLFAPGSRAEVPIIAEIEDPTGRGPPLMLNGQIDRLAVNANQVMIVDYKTNRAPPRDIKDVQEAYIFQLAAYRVALGLIFPGRDIRAALLWTQAPRLMEVPSALLDNYGSRLFELASRPLDLDGLAS